MSVNTWDCIVIGGGIVGSWAGYHLVHAGQKTLILDQFLLPHTRGSSSGHSRLFVLGQLQKLFCTLCPPSKALWTKLSEETNTTLFSETGMLYLKDGTGMEPCNNIEKTMMESKIAHTKLTPSELQRKYPHYHFGDQTEGLVDDKAGLLFAGTCLNAVQEQFKKNGGSLHDGEKVENIEPGPHIKVTTSKGIIYSTKKVIVCAGPWSKDVLSLVGLDLPVKTMPGLHLYFKVRDPSNSSFDADKGSPPLMSYLQYSADKYRFAGLVPCVEYPGMVKMVTRGEPPARYCHPDDRDVKESEEMINILCQYVKEHFPDLDPVPKIKEPCMYSMTPDKMFIIDQHPVYNNIIIGAGMSGNGFMMAPMVGQLLMELAIKQHTSYDLTETRLEGRFYSHAKL